MAIAKNNRIVAEDVTNELNKKATISQINTLETNINTFKNETNTSLSDLTTRVRI